MQLPQFLPMLEVFSTIRQARVRLRSHFDVGPPVEYISDSNMCSLDLPRWQIGSFEDSDSERSY